MRIRVVRVAHDDVFAARRLETREVRTPVATARLRDDDRAVCRRDLGRGVGRAVVDDDDLAGASRAPNPFERLVDDLPDRLLLVQARDDHGDLRPSGNHDRRVEPARIGRRPGTCSPQRVAGLPSGARSLAWVTVLGPPRCGSEH